MKGDYHDEVSSLYEEDITRQDAPVVNDNIEIDPQWEEDGFREDAPEVENGGLPEMINVLEYEMPSTLDNARRHGVVFPDRLGESHSYEPMDSSLLKEPEESRGPPGAAPPLSTDGANSVPSVKLGSGSEPASDESRANKFPDEEVYIGKQKRDSRIPLPPPEEPHDESDPSSNSSVLLASDDNRRSQPWVRRFLFDDLPDHSDLLGHSDLLDLPDLPDDEITAAPPLWDEGENCALPPQAGVGPGAFNPDPSSRNTRTIRQRFASARQALREMVQEDREWIRGAMVRIGIRSEPDPGENERPPAPLPEPVAERTTRREKSSRGTGFKARVTPYLNLRGGSGTPTPPPEEDHEDSDIPLMDLSTVGRNRSRDRSQDTARPADRLQDNIRPEEQSQDNTRPEEQSQDNSHPSGQSQDNSRPGEQLQDNSPPSGQSQGNSRLREQSQELSRLRGSLQDNTPPRRPSQDNTPARFRSQDDSRQGEQSQDNSRPREERHDSESGPSNPRPLLSPSRLNHRSFQSPQRGESFKSISQVSSLGSLPSPAELARRSFYAVQRDNDRHNSGPEISDRTTLVPPASYSPHPLHGQPLRGQPLPGQPPRGQPLPQQQGSTNRSQRLRPSEYTHPLARVAFYQNRLQNEQQEMSSEAAAARGTFDGSPYPRSPSRHGYRQYDRSSSDPGDNARGDDFNTGPPGYETVNNTAYQNGGQNMSQSVSQNVSQNVSQDASQDASQPGNQNADQNEGQNAGQNAGLNVHRRVPSPMLEGYIDAPGGRRVRLRASLSTFGKETGKKIKAKSSKFASLGRKPKSEPTGGVLEGPNPESNPSAPPLPPTTSRRLSDAPARQDTAQARPATTRQPTRPVHPTAPLPGTSQLPTQSVSTHDPEPGVTVHEEVYATNSLNRGFIRRFNMWPFNRKKRNVRRDF
ncbi:hypothetical protein ACLOAV_003965 [Pseudogymnoascus australis]